MLPRQGHYTLLQALLILALLVQTVAAASLSVELPCGDDAVASQAGVVLEHDNHAASADQARPCCCEDGLSCNPVDGCMQHCSLSLQAAFSSSGKVVNVPHVSPWLVPVLYPHEYARAEFRPPRNTA